MDFKLWWPEYYKKNCISKETIGRNTTKDRKVHFGISNHHQYTYNGRYKGYVKAKDFIDGLMLQTFDLGRRNHVPDSFPAKQAYEQGFVSLKSVKHVDLTKVLTYVPEEHQQFYQEILGHPTTV